jgi:hypothetical protein
MSDTRLPAASPPPTTVMPVLQGVSLDVAFADDVTFRSTAADYQGPADVVHVLRTIAEVVGRSPRPASSKMAGGGPAS